MVPSDAEFTSELIGCAVLDGHGASLGQLTALYTDADTGEVLFGGVAMLRRGRRRTVFAPLSDARVEGQTITLRCGGQLVRRAPAVQAGRDLPAEAEPGLYAHYDLAYLPATTGPRRLLLARH